VLKAEQHDLIDLGGPQMSRLDECCSNPAVVHAATGRR
jgi:hypothetical protein